MKKFIYFINVRGLVRILAILTIIALPRSSWAVYCENDPVNSLDPLGLDRTVYFAGHSWITVDTYDANGNKSGSTILSFTPNHTDDTNPNGSDFTTPNNPWFKQFNGLTIQSCREADEKLVRDWNIMKNSKKQFTWNVAQNCWLVTLYFAYDGIDDTAGINPNFQGNTEIPSWTP